jgi:hypothetical protein
MDRDELRALQAPLEALVACAGVTLRAVATTLASPPVLSMTCTT